MKKDSPGFIVNRFLFALYCEALHAHEEGMASLEDIDPAMKRGLNHLMGPFELEDYSGLDVILNVMDYLHEETGQSQYAPPLFNQADGVDRSIRNQERTRLVYIRLNGRPMSELKEDACHYHHECGSRRSYQPTRSRPLSTTV